MATALAYRADLPREQRQQIDFILLDGSGSMVDKWFDTLAAIQAYVDGVKSQNIRSHCILQVFDHNNLEYIARDCDIGDWKSLAADPIGSEFGYSPLYDAVNVMGRRLRDMDPPRCSIVIVTDGDANHDKFTDWTQAKSILDWCRAKGWQVTFIGAEFDNATQAARLGANGNTAIGVNKANLSNAIKALAAKRARYGLNGESMEYTDDEAQKFGGYLGHG